MTLLEPPLALSSVPDLPAAAVDDFPYETAAFHQCWWEHLAPRFDIPVKAGDLLIVRKRLCKGLLRLREARVAGWNNAWHQDMTPARVEALAELEATSGWDVFRLTWAENRAVLQALPAMNGLQAAGYQVLERPAPAQYRIDLAAGLEGYLQSLSHNSRKSLKKKTRKGQALGPALVDCSQADEIEAFFEALFDHHLRYWDAKAGHSYFHHREERQFILHWAKALQAKGQLRLERLIMGGETVNFSVGVQSGSSFYWLLTVNTGLHSEYAPGIIGLYLRLERLAVQGVTQVHMGAGDYFYKQQSANRQDACRELIVCNPRTWKGRLYYEWIKRQPVPAPVTPPA